MNMKDNLKHKADELADKAKYATEKTKDYVKDKVRLAKDEIHKK